PGQREIEQEALARGIRAAEAGGETGDESRLRHILRARRGEGGQHLVRAREGRARRAVELRGAPLEGGGQAGVGGADFLAGGGGPPARLAPQGGGPGGA